MNTTHSTDPRVSRETITHDAIQRPVRTGCFVALRAMNIGTDDLRGGWDNEWKDRRSEYVSGLFSNIVSKDATTTGRSMSVAVFLAVQATEASPARGYLTNYVLSGSKDLPGSATEPADSPSPFIPAWEKWHSLRQKAAANKLTEAETLQYSFLKAQAESYDLAAAETTRAALRTASALSLRDSRRIEDFVSVIQDYLDRKK